ncbi:cobalamin biosynthesis protein [Actinoalloteichus caeruleus]|uniref:cobalamin biosynthesis protein n=1 Tax=Actinoalloteichus cyanogriseus TaxID=2893586 RepID=UPI003BB8F2DD
MGAGLSAARAIGLLLGVAADAAFADARKHGVNSALRRLAAGAERRLHADDRGRGLAYVGLLAGGAVTLGVAVERVGRSRPLVQATATAAATWAVLGATAVTDEGTSIARHLDAGRLPEARARLAALWGRPPGQLDGPALARAAVETVARQASESSVAPLWWGALAGVPGLLGHRVVTLLDERVGHRTARFRNFGWAAARSDDFANFVPSRLTAALTAVCAPVVGGSGPGAWRTWRRDAVAHPSPNAGQAEAAFAGALEVRLGGGAAYHEGAEERPMLGDGRTPDAGDVTRGVELSRVVGIVAAAGSAAAAVALGQLRRRRGLVLPQG